MKKSDTQNIQQLIISDLTGVIDAREKERLEELKATDPEVLALSESMKVTFAQYHASVELEKEEWVDSAQITSHQQIGRSARFRSFTRYAAAAVLLIGIGLTIYYGGKRKSLPDRLRNGGAIVQTINNKNTRLALANGKVVDLSALMSDSVSLAGVQLAGTGKSLTYNISQQSETATQMNTLTVPIGKDFHLVLADGSEIWLNSATVLRFPFRFSGTSREIEVDGEAYLKVAQNAAMPFQVRTPNGLIKVLGTEFNVNSYDPGVMKVALLNGAVQLQAGNKSIQLKPGKEAVYTQQDIQVHDFDEDFVLSWTQGLFNFRTATLQEISRVLPRWFGVEVVMDRPQLTNAHFTGVMNRNAPITVFLDNIKFAMNIDYYFDKAGAVHFK